MGVTRRIIGEGLCMEQRKRDRQRLGTLRSLTIRPLTLRRYSEAKNLFVEWLELHGAWPTEIGGYDDLSTSRRGALGAG
jgi:hypothetical protein